MLHVFSLSSVFCWWSQHISLILSAAIWEADFYSWTRGLHSLLLRITVQGNAVLLGQGSQLLQELGVQDNGEDSALGLRGNSRTGGQDTERRQRQSVLHRAIGKRWIQDDVTAPRLEALCGTHTSIINWRLKNVLFVTFQKWLCSHFRRWPDNIYKLCISSLVRGLPSAISAKKSRCTHLWLQCWLPNSRKWTILSFTNVF